MKKDKVFTVREDNDIALSFGVDSEERADEMRKEMNRIENEEIGKGIDENIGCRVIERISNEIGKNDPETHYAIFCAGTWFSGERGKFEGLNMGIGDFLKAMGN